MKALGSITSNKASGGDGNPAELYQILKDDSVLKKKKDDAVNTNMQQDSISQQVWKTQQWPQD